MNTSAEKAKRQRSSSAADKARILALAKAKKKADKKKVNDAYKKQKKRKG